MDKVYDSQFTEKNIKIILKNKGYPTSFNTQAMEVTTTLVYISSLIKMAKIQICDYTTCGKTLGEKLLSYTVFRILIIITPMEGILVLYHNYKCTYALS